jgi:hypothetical protein
MAVLMISDADPPRRRRPVAFCNISTLCLMAAIPLDIYIIQSSYSTGNSGFNGRSSNSAAQDLLPLESRGE